MIIKMWRGAVRDCRFVLVSKRIKLDFPIFVYGWYWIIMLGRSFITLIDYASEYLIQLWRHFISSNTIIFHLSLLSNPRKLTFMENLNTLLVSMMTIPSNYVLAKFAWLEWIFLFHILLRRHLRLVRMLCENWRPLMRRVLFETVLILYRFGVFISLVRLDLLLSFLDHHHLHWEFVEAFLDFVWVDFSVHRNWIKLRRLKTSNIIKFLFLGWQWHRTLNCSPFIVFSRPFHSVRYYAKLFNLVDLDSILY